jgi:hypothetical protein
MQSLCVSSSLISPVFLVGLSASFKGSDFQLTRYQFVLGYGDYYMPPLQLSEPVDFPYVRERAINAKSCNVVVQLSANLNAGAVMMASRDPFILKVADCCASIQRCRICK